MNDSQTDAILSVYRLLLFRHLGAVRQENEERKAEILSLIEAYEYEFQPQIDAYNSSFRERAR